MKKYPNIIHLATVHNINKKQTPQSEACIGGLWYPARPIGLMTFRNRVKAALLVFTGKADALIWPAGQ